MIMMLNIHPHCHIKNYTSSCSLLCFIRKYKRKNQKKNMSPLACPKSHNTPPETQITSPYYPKALPESLPHSHAGLKLVLNGARRSFAGEPKKEARPLYRCSGKIPSSFIPRLLLNNEI